MIVNAHLYGAHVQTGRTLLPEHTRLVIDEAHEFEDSIVGSLSIELTEGRLANLARVHDRSVAGRREVATSLRSAGQMLEATLEGLARDGSGPVSQVRLREGWAPSSERRRRHVVARGGPGAQQLAACCQGSRSDARAATASTAPCVWPKGVLGDAQALLGEQGSGRSAGSSPRANGRHAVRLTRIDVAATLRAAGVGGLRADRRVLLGHPRSWNRTTAGTRRRVPGGGLAVRLREPGACCTCRSWRCRTTRCGPNRSPR